MGINVQLPAPVPLTPIEQAFIEEEPANLFPQNQDSNTGLHRKIFCDELTSVSDQIQLIFNEKWPFISTEFLQYHEFQMGIPMNPPFTILQRQNLVMIQWLRGPFTTTLVNTVIAFFVSAVLSPFPPPAFGTLGIPIDGGIPLYSGLGGSPYDYFTVDYDPAQFYYTVIINPLIEVDLVGLTRELRRITPAGMDFSIESREISPAGKQPQSTTFIPQGWLGQGPFSNG